MKKHLLLTLIIFLQMNFIRGQEEEKPKQYRAVGLFDHKTGLGIIGIARTLYQKDKSEIFVGLGLIPAGTLSLGWKRLMNDGPIKGYSVFSIQKISAMGGEFIAPYFSFGGEKKLTDNLFFNLGISSVVRVYPDKKNQILCHFPRLI